MAKVLLVEDDNNLREIYEARLSAEGYEITTAQNGEEALSIAKQVHPDLIVSDVMMPRISGFEMLDILRNTDELKDTKIIMLTALGQAEDRGRADNLGADKYLVKSQVTLEDIVNAAKSLLGEDQPTVIEPTPVQATETTAVASEPVTEPSPQPEPTPEPAIATPPVPAVVTPAPEPVAEAPAPIAAPVTPAPEPTAEVATPTVQAPIPTVTVADTPPVAVPAAPPTLPVQAEPLTQPVTTTVTVADPDPLQPAVTDNVSSPVQAAPTVATPPLTPPTAMTPPVTAEPAQPLPSAPSLGDNIPSVAEVPALVAPEIAPAPTPETPIAAETQPEPVQPAPVASPPVTPPEPALDTSLDPATAQTLADEEAAIQSQINAFAAEQTGDVLPAQPATTPSVEAAAPAPTTSLASTTNDAVLDDAIQKLTSSGIGDVAPAPAETAAPEVTPPEPAEPVSTPTPEADTDTSQEVTGRKVIQPLSHEDVSTPNIEALLAAEDAKNTTDPSPVVGLAPPTPSPEKPGIDPNSIAL